MFRELMENIGVLQPTTLIAKNGGNENITGRQIPDIPVTGVVLGGKAAFSVSADFILINSSVESCKVVGILRDISPGNTGKLSALREHILDYSISAHIAKRICAGFSAVYG